MYLLSRNLETWEGGWVCPGPCLRRAGGVLSRSLATSGGCAVLPRPVLWGASAVPPDPCEAPEERRGGARGSGYRWGGRGSEFQDLRGSRLLGHRALPASSFCCQQWGGCLVGTVDPTHTQDIEAQGTQVMSSWRYIEAMRLCFAISLTRQFRPQPLVACCLWMGGIHGDFETPFFFLEIDMSDRPTKTSKDCL